MAARTGAEFIKGLRDGRQVWLGKEKICDVTTHPALAGSVAGMAGYFDWQHRYAEDCLVPDPMTGAPMNASLILPRNADDLTRRHRAFDRLARYSCGMLGRTPDYVNVTLAGFTACADYFARKGDRTLSDRVCRFYREVVEKDLSMTHTIIHPAIDKSKNDLEGLNAELATRIVGRTKNGVIVRGAKILATLGPFADELFVYPAAPLAPGSAPEFAISFSIPVATKGVITLCRDHYGTARSLVDQPFSPRFDEQDAFIIFDDVEVPYERLFIDGDLELYNGLRNTGWAANVFQQTSTRAAVKLEFAYDLCTRMAQLTNAAKRPDVAVLLGEIWTYAQLTRAATKAAMVGARDNGGGAFLCDDGPLRALRDVMPTWMVRVNDIIKTVGGHNLLATPSLAAFDNPEMAPFLHRYLPAATDAGAPERARIFRMAWDFAGSALGTRVELYERLYLASQHRNYSRDHVQAMTEGGFGVLDEFLAS